MAGVARSKPAASSQLGPQKDVCFLVFLIIPATGSEGSAHLMSVFPNHGKGKTVHSHRQMFIFSAAFIGSLWSRLSLGYSAFQFLV